MTENSKEETVPPATVSTTKIDSTTERPKANRVEIGTLVVLVLTLFVGALQTQRQLDATQKTNSAADRARIGVFTAYLAREPKINGPLSIAIQYANTGREAADTFIWGEGTFYDRDEWKEGLTGRPAIESNQFRDRCLAGQFAAEGKSTHVTYPTTGSPNFTASYTFKEPLDQSVINGTRVAVVRACFTYWTQNKRQHTAACFSYQNAGNVSHNLAYCLQGQGAD